jgi:hypothetical protein
MSMSALTGSSDEVLHSSHKVSMTSRCEGKALRIKPDVPVCVLLSDYRYVLSLVWIRTEVGYKQ